MILFYTEKITPRVDYTVRLIFENILKANVTITDNYEEFTQSEFPGINYSEKESVSGISVKPYGLLFKNKIEKFSVPEEWFNPERSFFPKKGRILPFDIFAAAFYLVSRFEEYLIPERDKYGRFAAEQSILFTSGLLKKPLVNIWAESLAEIISSEYPGFHWTGRKFRFLSTIDVDNAWAFRNKGFIRTFGAILKSLANQNYSTFSERLKVLAGIKEDPYFNYSYLDSVFDGHQENVTFFFLLGDYNKHDKGVSYKNKNLRKLIRKTAGKYITGIHPSFLSATDKSGKIQLVEIKRLEEITGNRVKLSRQHFLKISFPDTYRNLFRNGIQTDFSMGYASQTGFRAGICTPFNFYDLGRETKTDMVIIPFQVMDVTLQQYLKLSQDSAIKEILELMEEVKKVKGIFVSCWHNESLSDSYQWKGWRKVFEIMNQKGFEWGNE